MATTTVSAVPQRDRRAVGVGHRGIGGVDDRGDVLAPGAGRATRAGDRRDRQAGRAQRVDAGGPVLADGVPAGDTGGAAVATVVVVAAVVAVVEAVVGGSGTAGQDGIRPMLASVLTEATNVSGAVGSGRASHGSRAATRTRNSAGAPVIVAVKSNRQFHCPPPADMSSQRLAVIVPDPISSFAVASRMTTGAPDRQAGGRPASRVGPTDARAVAEAHGLGERVGLGEGGSSRLDTAGGAGHGRSR